MFVYWNLSFRFVRNKYLIKILHIFFFFIYIQNLIFMYLFIGMANQINIIIHNNLINNDIFYVNYLNNGVNWYNVNEMNNNYIMLVI